MNPSDIPIILRIQSKWMASLSNPRMFHSPPKRLLCLLAVPGHSEFILFSAYLHTNIIFLFYFLCFLPWDFLSAMLFPVSHLKYHFMPNDTGISLYFIGHLPWNCIITYLPPAVGTVYTGNILITTVGKGPTKMHGIWWHSVNTSWRKNNMCKNVKKKLLLISCEIGILQGL